MDICQELEAKYPGIFHQLIEQYQSLSVEERKKTGRLIKNLLKENCWHGEAIQLYLEGQTLAEIGRRLNLTRERIRQVIERYRNYYYEVGSKDWCLTQLKKLLDSHYETGILPSNEEINNFNSKLLSSLKKHFIGKKGSTLKELELFYMMWLKKKVILAGCLHKPNAFNIPIIKKQVLLAFLLVLLHLKNQH